MSDASIVTDDIEKLSLEQTHDRSKALEEQLRGFSKTTLVLMLANATVFGAWMRNAGRTDAIDRACGDLVEKLLRWRENGRAENRNRRLDRFMARCVETAEARATGKPIPAKYRPARKRRRRVKP